MAFNMFKKKDTNNRVQKAKKNSQQSRKRKKTVLSNSFLQEIVPLGNIKFSSEYFMTGVNYGTILTFVADAGAVTQLPPMWGSRLIPVTSDASVKASLFTAFQTRPKEWVENRTVIAAEVYQTASQEAKQHDYMLEESRSRNRVNDHAVTAHEISSGASYLDVTYKILLYAPTLEILQDTISELSRQYKTRFGSARLTRNIGEQHVDFKNLLGPATTQLGHHDGFTSVELAGYYPFVGSGWRDKGGEYIGLTVGDVNQTPVLYDANTTGFMTLIGASGKANMIGRSKPYNFSSQAGWQTLFTQRELLEGRNVYELVLNNENLSSIGMDLKQSTAIIPMDKGIINPLQAFGTVENELAAYAILKNKLKTMIKQLNAEMTDEQLMFLDKALDEFYIEQGLWADNAKDNRDSLRMVGLSDYTQIPMLSKFVVSLDGKYKLYAQGTASISSNSIAADNYLKLSGMVNNMLGYGDLFDTFTTFDDRILKGKQRKIFPFAKLKQSGTGVLMAQFVNILTYILGEIQPGDVIHIYGAETISPSIWTYIQDQLTYLQDIDVKLVIGFNSVSRMIDSPVFSQAETVISGSMSSVDISNYSQTIQGELPSQLVKKITEGDSKTYYLRRNTDNVVFKWDLVL